MDLGLRGDRVLITGGSRGIGLAVATSLAAEGASVGLVARDEEGLAAAAAAELSQYNVPVATAAADVTDTPALRRAVEAIAGRLNGLDHLVANAGGTVGGGNLGNAADDEFTATFALNAGHAAELIRAGLPHLRTSGHGSVVIVSSITGMRPAPRTAYAAAKAAEIQLAATAAQELAPDGIRVNSVSPGSIPVPRRWLGELRSAEPRRLRHLPGHPVPARPAGPAARGRRRDHVPAVPAGLLGHRRQHRRRRGAALPQRPPVPLSFRALPPGPHSWQNR
jgi:3-oxoacyl-[acyl-carrier protein] reductase